MRYGPPSQRIYCRISPDHDYYLYRHFRCLVHLHWRLQELGLVSALQDEFYYVSNSLCIRYLPKVSAPGDAMHR